MRKETEKDIARGSAYINIERLCAMTAECRLAILYIIYIILGMVLLFLLLFAFSLSRGRIRVAFLRNI